MWTEGILNRYAHTLPQLEGSRLKKEIKTIQWEQGSGSKLCMADEGERAFERAGLADYYRDLTIRVLEFTRREDEDAIVNCHS